MWTDSRLISGSQHYLQSLKQDHEFFGRVHKFIKRIYILYSKKIRIGLDTVFNLITLIDFIEIQINS